jgi:hypothetical protein
MTPKYFILMNSIGSPTSFGFRGKKGTPFPQQASKIATTPLSGREDILFRSFYFYANTHVFRVHHY